MTLRQLIDEELDLTNFEKQYGQLMQSLNNFSEQAKNVYNDPNILKNFENLKNQGSAIGQAMQQAKLEQQKKHKSNKSGESIEISDISKNNMNQSRSAVSAIQNETENEHMIQRRNTAQRLINDPKLQQIRMFMERYKPKKKEDGNNSNTMFKRSKSTMVTSDTVNSLKKLSR